MIKKLRRREVAVDVPASKSILNRALPLAAFTGGTTLLTGARQFGKDSREMIGCLEALGVEVTPMEEGLLIDGSEARKSGSLDVGSGGTTARFLTAVLAFRGGEYDFRASAQMTRRPMGLLAILRSAGVKFEFSGEKGTFPFRMLSRGIAPRELTVDTDATTQFASGILLAAGIGRAPLLLRLTGSRTNGSYLATTLDVLRAFGADVEQRDSEILVTPSVRGAAAFYVPPDCSGACYFYALSLLCGAKVLVRGMRRECGQADRRFLDVLASRGVLMTETEEGLVADGRETDGFDGFDLDLKDFSDQTMTFAAMAPFARTPSVLRNIGHIRRQECDRIEAILHNLSVLGVPCRTDGENIFISPAPVHPAVLESFSDHRVAMAFALVGLKAGGIQIKDPACCEKTFENYFELLRSITK